MGEGRPTVWHNTQERQKAQCLLQALGRTAEMATGLALAYQGDLTGLADAAGKCEIDLGPGPGQADTPSTPMDTATTLVITVSEPPRASRSTTGASGSTGRTPTETARTPGRRSSSPRAWNR